jgi:DNA (cytosine-5)-methyltransferase 1
MGRGFEKAGFIVVRGPDPIYGGDIREFRGLPGRFDGVIGGPPCQDYSKARRSAPSGIGYAMLQEFVRVVLECRPTWWVMENVPQVPTVRIPGYSHLRLDLNALDFGSDQNRHRHFQYGHAAGLIPIVTRATIARPGKSQPCCLASEGSGRHRRTWADFCRLQGLPEDFQLPGMTQEARYRAVGNGVHVDVAEALARAISTAAPVDSRLCECCCGRLVTGRQRLATPACRKRKQRAMCDRQGVTVPGQVTPAASQ